jgi:polyribitol phosphate beta-O-GlcNActransferase TarS-like protein
VTTHPEAEASVLRDMLSVYDRRFLDLAAPQRRRLVEGTRQVMGDGLSADVRAALPVAYRIRAFCIQHDLHDELERLIREEADGRQEGAIVVGGRVYAVYPYLRGVPRHDVDITAEVTVAHRLDEIGWHGARLRIRGAATLERVHARAETAELILRERASAVERRCPAGPHDNGFEVLLSVADLPPGRWDCYAAVSALGITREARFGAIRNPRLKPAQLERPPVTAYFTDEGHLAVLVTATAQQSGVARRVRRLLNPRKG